jgi:hypothetical protein
MPESDFPRDHNRYWTSRATKITHDVRLITNIRRMQADMLVPSGIGRSHTLNSESTPLGRADCLSFDDYWLRFVLQRDGFFPRKFRWAYCLVLRYAFPVGSMEVTA